jgi:dual specificity tyrosine-phosphorylation-regulated kinase 2/3/4
MKMQKIAGLNLPFIRRIAIQLLLGLKDIHSSGVIHCDIKPQNILLKHIRKTGVKIIDFGISCIGKPKIYSYLQTRYYRSPEVILGCSFGPAVDIWSLGCVLAELLNGSPIFKGEDEHDQMIKIMALLGTPPFELLEKGYKRRYFFHMDNTPILKPNKAGEILQPTCFSLRQVLKTDDESFIDFLAACFEYLPEKRITATEALKHRWILRKESK